MKHKLLSSLVSFEGAKRIFKGIGSLVENNMYTVNLAMIDWCIDQTIAKVFPNIPFSPTCEFTSSSNKPVVNYRSEFCEIQHNVSRITFYKNTPIWLNIEPPVRNQSRFTYPRIFLKTINTKKNRETLMEFITKLCAMGQRDHVKRWSSDGAYFTSCECMQPIAVNQMRTFNDIFVPDEHLDLIKTSIDKFVGQRDWYRRNNIPYHFGILLYGDPGTGKSVLAQAIATYLNAKLFVISGDAVKQFPSMLGREIQTSTISADTYQVILIEDIDCGIKGLNRENNNTTNYEHITPDDLKQVNRTTGLASILNAIDGVSSPTNTIFVFTTNHIEDLDPALFRPGRCDLSLEIGYVTKETFNKFCKYHYGENAPDDLEIRDNILFAQIQCELMRGKTLNELCEFVRKEDGQI